ncbi:hypothetical protein HOLleu_05096 [Holothuria leucospilota]|uniref:Plexin cytoplasmic RhoGTPase-binding domain-containing protein n=1 Tax=Holothuria leucospilota TaxID=206669 RepID=A0A9Q1CKL4_HOLLE|nr:hypothetical protein HOLleu_05096 [Holothuria leucospilota]
MEQDCWIKTPLLLQCLAPSFKEFSSFKEPHQDHMDVRKNIVVGFRMDGVTALSNWSLINGVIFQYFEDPNYFPFENDEQVFQQESRDFIEIKVLNVIFRNISTKMVELSFLSVDSITQVKAKILDYFSQGQPTQMRYSPDDFDLGR